MKEPEKDETLDETEENPVITALQGQIDELKEMIKALTEQKAADETEEESDLVKDLRAQLEEAQKQIEEMQKAQEVNGDGNVTGDGNTTGDGNNSGNTSTSGDTTNNYTDSSVKDSNNTNTDSSVNDSNNTNNDSHDTTIDGSFNDSHNVDIDAEFRDNVVALAQEKKDMLLEKLKSFFEWDGKSKYRITAKEYEALKEKLENGEELTKTEKLQMAVFNMETSVADLISGALSRSEQMSKVDESSLKSMTDDDGNPLFKDAEGKILSETIDEEGNRSYLYEDGTAFEGDAESLSAMKGFPTIDEEKGAMFTDADGNVVYRKTGEDGTDTFTKEDGSPFEGDPSSLKEHLTEYVTDEDIMKDQIGRAHV